VFTQRLVGQRRTTLNEETRLRAMIAAGITANPQTILQNQFGANYAGMPGSVLQNFLEGVIRTAPLLRKEMEWLGKAARSAAPGTAAPAGTDPADPAGADPAGGGTPDLDGSPFGGLSLHGIVDGIIAGVLWNAWLDWEDLVAGEIVLGGWIKTRVKNSVENQLAAAAGGALGSLLFADPTGAALVGFAFYFAAVSKRAADKQEKLDRFNAEYRAALADIDERYELLAAQHDDAVRSLRERYTNDCEAAVAGMPTEQDFKEIELAAAALYPVTRQLVIVAPRRRHFPGMTRSQERVLRARLRIRRRSWLRALGTARHKPRGGEFLDLLDLLVTTNREVLTDADLLAETDWDATARRLAADLAAWDRATQNWAASAEAGIRACLATYQQQGQKLQTDFLAARADLMNERLEALLDLVNKSRRLNNRKPLPSVTVMLERIKSGRLSFKPRKGP
jgi:hypothetical protein